MDDDDEIRHKLFHDLPPLVVGLALLLAGVEIWFQLGRLGFAGGAEAIGWRMAAMRDWGFSAPLFEQMLVRREFPADGLARFLSYGLVHAGLVHTLFAVVLVLALGKAVAERFSGLALVASMLVGQVVGAVVYWALLDGRHLLVGAYPAIYGLLGAFTWSLWMRAEGRGRLAAFRLVGVLLALQVAFRMVENTGDVWVAEAGAFAAGFGLAFVLAPDGGERLRRVRDRVRGL